MVAIECVKANACTEESENVMTYFKRVEAASSEVVSVLGAMLIEERDKRQKGKK